MEAQNSSAEGGMARHDCERHRQAHEDIQIRLARYVNCHVCLHGRDIARTKPRTKP